MTGRIIRGAAAAVTVLAILVVAPFQRFAEAACRDVSRWEHDEK